MNRNNPTYIKPLYTFADRYTKFYQGDGNLDRATNGGWRFLQNYILEKKPKVVFDVGGHDGAYIRKIREFGSDAIVYAFEPVTATYAKLCENMSEDHRVIPVHMALSSSVGSRVIHINPDIDAIATLSEVNGTKYDYRETETVQCTTVDLFAKENDIEAIDFLKIDTEGHDLEVIRGAENLLRNGKIRTIVFEFGTLNTFSHTYLWDFAMYLEPFGFELYKIKPLGLEKVIDPLNERSIYAYFVAIKK